MKHNYLIFWAIILAMGIAFFGCEKDPLANTPKIVDDNVSVAIASVTFTWKVEWAGKRISVVEVSEHEDMSNSKFYGSEEELNKTDFKVTVTDLQPSTKYYYRYWVWNSNYVDAKFVMETKSFTTLFQPQGVFSISYSKKVYFSQGNLQYRASDGCWRFASHQYDYIGVSNNNISSTYDDWIDLFGWGTGDNPTNATTYNEYDIFSDWGSKMGDGWRTLTSNEWTYVFQERPGASSKYGHGKVNGVCGMILLPDNWFLPSGLNFTIGSSSWSNVYTKEQWARMEDNGAVFLPAAGYRIGTSVYEVGSYGYYWSASYYDYDEAYCVRFYSGSSNPSYRDRDHGHSVRLVCPAN